MYIKISLANYQGKMVKLNENVKAGAELGRVIPYSVSAQSLYTSLDGKHLQPTVFNT